MSFYSTFLSAAVVLVKTAGIYEADIRIRNVTRDTPFLSAKSLLDVVVRLKAAQGHLIELKADGDDAAEAIEAIRELIDSNFGEQSEA